MSGPFPGGESAVLWRARKGANSPLGASVGVAPLESAVGTATPGANESEAGASDAANADGLTVAPALLVPTAPADVRVAIGAVTVGTTVAVAPAVATAASHTRAGEGGGAGLPAAGTYLRPSASPSLSVRVETPTLVNCHAPPPWVTKTAQ
jgi:hypothetical protein